MVRDGDRELYLAKEGKGVIWRKNIIVQALGVGAGGRESLGLGTQQPRG